MNSTWQFWNDVYISCQITTAYFLLLVSCFSFSPSTLKVCWPKEDALLSSGLSSAMLCREKMDKEAHVGSRGVTPETQVWTRRLPTPWQPASCVGACRFSFPGFLFLSNSTVLKSACEKNMWSFPHAEMSSAPHVGAVDLCTILWFEFLNDTPTCTTIFSIFSCSSWFSSDLGQYLTSRRANTRAKHTGHG